MFMFCLFAAILGKIFFHVGGTMGELFEATLLAIAMTAVGFLLEWLLSAKGERRDV